MASVPLSLALPAVAAGASYLNARLSLWYDWHLITSVIPSYAAMGWRERTDRLNPFYVLERHAQNKTQANRTLIIFEGKSYTYAQVYEQVLKYGAWLRERHGIKPKEIVAVNCQNSDVFVFLWYGLWSIGAKPAFMNYNLTGNALAHCVKTATTRFMLIDPLVADNVNEEVRAAIPDVTCIVLTPEVHAEIESTQPCRYPDKDRYEDKYENLAILIYTSGTTGLPKPAIVSYGKCIVGSNFTSRFISNKPGEVFYTSMPLYHSSAALLGFGNVMESGGTVALGRKFSTKLFWDEVRASGATAIQYVGETCRYLLAAPPQLDPVTGENLDKKHSVRVAFGNGLRPDVWNEFKERFGIQTIAEFYAATEGTLGTWNLSNNDFARGAIGRNGSIYNTIMSLGVAVVELDVETESPWRDPKTGLCKRVPVGEPGELLFKIDATNIERRFQGYYNNKKATMSKVMRDVLSKGDAWFRTGDMVRWDDEGRVFFSDRIGDTFRWKSENVSTQEVSEAVGKHGSVSEANVYGVQLPHHDGRAGCAAVVFDDGSGAIAQPDDKLLRSLAAHVKKELPRYALPIFLRVMPRLGMQMTGTNKQQKTVLQKEGIWLPEGAESVMYWLRNDTYVPFTKRDWDEMNGGRVKL